MNNNLTILRQLTIDIKYKGNKKNHCHYKLCDPAEFLVWNMSGHHSLQRYKRIRKSEFVYNFVPNKTFLSHIFVILSKILLQMTNANLNY